MQSPKYYFEKSLFGYFCKRVAEKWGSLPKFPDTINYYGVMLRLDCLPRDMQAVIMARNYELSEITLIPGFIQPEDKVLEIGSAIGFIGLHCRKVIGVKELICVEPNPKTASYLLKNYELNGMIPNLIPAALSSSDGPVSFYVSDMFWCDAIDIREDVKNGSEITVDGLTFSSIVQQTKIKFNTLIIDIEGGEKYISLDVIPESIEKVLIEIHPEVIGVRSAYSIIENLIRLGFEVQGAVSNTWAMKRHLQTPVR